jgi:hypothetical protein
MFHIKLAGNGTAAAASQSTTYRDGYVNPEFLRKYIKISVRIFKISCKPLFSML